MSSLSDISATTGDHLSRYCLTPRAVLNASKISINTKVADSFGGFLETIGLAEPLIRTFAEDIEHYWNTDSAFGTDVRWRLTKPLLNALKEGDNIFLVSHSLGTMIAYDVLWKFSHYGE